MSLFHKRSRARRCVLQGLYQWQMTQVNMTEIEQQLLMDIKPAQVDVEYFSALLSNIPQVLTQLDQSLQPYLDRPLEQIDLIERAILRLGTYELKFRADIPPKVVLNESINLAKTFGAEQGHKYINSILDKVAKSCVSESTN